MNDLDNYGKPKSEFIESLKIKTESELYDVCKEYIWLSAYASNNPRSDYHWKCDACYDECANRGKNGAGGIYERAHKSVMKDCGY